jgi:hypothetical protein
MFPRFHCADLGEFSFPGKMNLREPGKTRRIAPRHRETARRRRSASRAEFKPDNSIASAPDLR